jgi:hypothetical protein
VFGERYTSFRLTLAVADGSSRAALQLQYNASTVSTYHPGLLHPARDQDHPPGIMSYPRQCAREVDPVIVKVVVTAGLVLIAAAAVAVLLGANHWQAATRQLHAALDDAREPIALDTWSLRDLDGLPEPVQRYLRQVLPEGQPIISAATLRHTGTFNLSESGEKWSPFSSTQRVVTRRPGFVWDARIRMAPGMKVHVHDAYVAGNGVLTAKLFGLFTVMEQPATSELAHGELMRFLGEAPWYPTVWLPGQGVEWQDIDATQARATLTDRTISVTLVVRFDDQGLIDSVSSDARFRDVDGVQVATPWQGRFWDYTLRDGMLISLEGEVAWLSPEGPKPYWRGRISDVSYEFVP